MLRPVPMSSAGRPVPPCSPPPPPLARNAWHHGVARHGATLWQRVAALQWPWQVPTGAMGMEIWEISKQNRHHQVELASTMGYHVIAIGIDANYIGNSNWNCYHVYFGMFHMLLELGSYNYGNIGTQEHLMIFYGDFFIEIWWEKHQQSWTMETLGYFLGIFGPTKGLFWCQNGINR